MHELLIQIQPDRLPSFHAESTRQLRSTLSFAPFVEGVDITEGYDDGRYINVLFSTEEPKRLWLLVREELMRLGLRNGAIVTCTGKDGWDDYLLLHHFDRDVPSDG